MECVDRTGNDVFLRTRGGADHTLELLAEEDGNVVPCPYTLVPQRHGQVPRIVLPVDVFDDSAEVSGVDARRELVRPLARLENYDAFDPASSGYRAVAVSWWPSGSSNPSRR
ncbi:MAG: hypothetical protein ACI9WU_004290 [Myxococcota bacterium]